jgi:hypothetical protein
MAMTAKNEIEKRLEALRLEYRKTYSLLSMMEKGTKREDLAKLRAQQLDPIRSEIKKLEAELS